MSWDPVEYQKQTDAWNAARAEKRKAEEIERALEVLKKHGYHDHEAIKAEHAQFRQALIEVEEQRIELEDRLSGNALHQENQALRQQGRDRDWRDAWRDVARESGMIPKAVDAAWKHHGPAAESDEPDRKALRTLVSTLKSEAPYFWPDPVKEAPADPPADRESEPATSAAGGPRFVFQDGAWKSNGNAG